MPFFLIMPSIKDLAKKDWQRFTSDPKGHGESMTLIAPTSETLIITGLHTRHNLDVSTDGRAVNSMNAHISISEKLLTDAAYPHRNDDDIVDFKGHKAIAKDSRGTEITYMIREWWPDETVGMIVCKLGSYE